jgi:hypothetical protein
MKSHREKYHLHKRESDMLSKIFWIAILIQTPCYGNDVTASKATCKIVKHHIIDTTKGSCGTGTAFAIKDDFILVVTAAHVVKDSSHITCSFLHGTYEAHLLNINHNVDIAVLWIKTKDVGKFTIAKFSSTLPNKDQTFYSYQHPGCSLRQIKRSGKFQHLSVANIAAGPGSSGSGVFHNGEIYAVLIRSNWTDRTIFVSLPQMYTFVSACCPTWALGGKPPKPTLNIKPATPTTEEKRFSRLEEVLKNLLAKKAPEAVPTLFDRFKSKIKSYAFGRAMEAVGISALGGHAGIAGLLISSVWFLARRRIKKRRSKSSDSNFNSLKEDLDAIKSRLQPKGGDPESGGNFPPQLPPRKIDEIYELHELGQIEGRDPYLDQAFGMFAEDEIQKRIDTEGMQELLSAIQERVNKAAPLSFLSDQKE